MRVAVSLLEREEAASFAVSTKRVGPLGLADDLEHFPEPGVAARTARKTGNAFSPNPKRGPEQRRNSLDGHLQSRVTLDVGSARTRAGKRVCAADVARYSRR